MLPPAQFGVLAILLTFQTFCGFFLVNPVGQYINRQTHTWADEGSLRPRLRRYRVWVITAALVGASASTLWAASQATPWEELARVSVAVAVMGFVTTANATALDILNMLGHRSLAVGWGVASAVLGLILSLTFTGHFGVGLAWFAGQAMGMAVGAWGAIRAVHGVLPLASNAPQPLLEVGALHNYIFPLAVSTGLMWWLISGYRLLLEAHWGLAALGGAVVGLSLASQLWGLLESLAMQFLYPLFYRRIAASRTPDSALAFSDLLNTLGPIYLVMASATVVGAPSLLALLVDTAYANVVPFVLLGVVVEFCRALSNVLGTAAQVDRRMGALIIPYAAGALVLTIGLLSLSQTEGSIAQAIAVLAGAGLVTLLMMALVMQRLQRFIIDWPRWGAALSLIVCAVCEIAYKPQVPAGLFEALELVVLIGIVAAGAVAALLWNNPSVTRLLAARLGPAME